MDDTCAVCAESLEWVGYGACGHRDVCSTCVARLRFICDDRRCCICKSDSAVVFVTKALGEYTNSISDFSVLPSEAKEGRVGQYWYHEDTQAFFDDMDHYNMIKAMCRLSCNVCDKTDGHPDDAPRRRAKFRNVEQLKGHLFHKHRLTMCSLCLEGRKVFICEQKLYTRSQLTQHTNTGDSEVDGTESERGGFAGHPRCEFCRTPFYGDNELYTHMSTEHYTCHICQRQHPGQYEYYKNYDDLEMHFRRDHFLCEDDGCLGEKFIVFPSEAELKRHNALKHGGRMSRSKRVAALQIPTSFRYRRSSEQDNHRGRGPIFRRDPRDDELSLAIQASLETASAGPSGSRVRVEHGEMDDGESLVPPFESSINSDSEVVSSRYRQAVSHSSVSRPLGESSFPPLPVVPSGSSQRNSKSDHLSKKNMAAHLRRQGNRKVNASSPSSSSSPAWPAASRAAAPVQPSITPSNGWPAISNVSGSSYSSTSRQTTQRTGVRPPPASSSNNAAASQPHLPSVTADSLSSSKAADSSSSSKSSGRMSHSLSAPNLSQRGSIGSSCGDFPPISATQPPRKPPATEEVKVKVKDVHTANKSLVEQMRSALGYDEDTFSAFKEISGEYRQGSMDARTYIDYVDQFGLSHLVLELARLLPDAGKQKELIEAHNFKMVKNIRRGDGWSNGIRIKDSNGGSDKGKGKAVDTGSRAAKKNNNLADDIISKVKELQSSYRASEEEEVEVLSKDGYRADRGKSKVVADESQVELGGHRGAPTKLKSKIDASSTGDGAANQNLGDGNGKSKQRKKTSKFLRARLGDGSVEAHLDLNNTDPDPDPGLNSNGGATDSTESLPVRGVWRNGGGHKLLSKAPKN